MRKMCKNCLHFVHCINIPNYPVTNNTIACNDWLSKNQYVPVVRCKDCTRRGTVRCPMYFEEVIDLDDDGLSLEIHDHTEDEGFCNYGEKEQKNEETFEKKKVDL